MFASPQSFLRLRSCCTAVWHAMGPWTMSVNINPSDLNSPLVFEVITLHSFHRYNCHVLHNSSNGASCHCLRLLPHGAWVQVFVISNAS